MLAGPVGDANVGTGKKNLQSVAMCGRVRIGPNRYILEHAVLFTSKLSPSTLVREVVGELLRRTAEKIPDPGDRDRIMSADIRGIFVTKHHGAVRLDDEILDLTIAVNEVPLPIFVELGEPRASPTESQPLLPDNTAAPSATPQFVTLQVDRKGVAQSAFAFAEPLYLKLARSIGEPTSEIASDRPRDEAGRIVVTCEELMQNYDAILSIAADEAMNPFLCKLDDFYPFLKHQRCIAYENLGQLFPLGHEVWGTYFGEIVAGEILEAAFVPPSKASYRVAVQVTKSDGLQFLLHRHDFEIPAFIGRISIDCLPVRWVTAGLKRQLDERGRLYARHAVVPVEMDYDGNVILQQGADDQEAVHPSSHRSVPQGTTLVNVEGRVLIDPVSFARQANANSFAHGKVAIGKSVPTERLWTCFPFLPAFCLNRGLWGQVSVGRLKDCVRRKGVFERSVLISPETRMVLNNVCATKMDRSIAIVCGPAGSAKSVSVILATDEADRPLFRLPIPRSQDCDRQWEDVFSLAELWSGLVVVENADQRDWGEHELDSFHRLYSSHECPVVLICRRRSRLPSLILQSATITVRMIQPDLFARIFLWKTRLADDDGISEEDIDDLADARMTDAQITMTLRIARTLAGEGISPTHAHYKQAQTIVLGRCN